MNTDTGCTLVLPEVIVEHSNLTKTLKDKECVTVQATDLIINKLIFSVTPMQSMCFVFTGVKFLHFSNKMILSLLPSQRKQIGFFFFIIYNNIHHATKVFQCKKDSTGELLTYKYRYFCMSHTSESSTQPWNNLTVKVFSKAKQAFIETEVSKWADMVHPWLTRSRKNKRRSLFSWGGFIVWISEGAFLLLWSCHHKDKVSNCH